jgi:hypothetical protein
MPVRLRQAVRGSCGRCDDQRVELPQPGPLLGRGGIGTLASASSAAWASAATRARASRASSNAACQSDSVAIPIGTVPGDE